MRAAPYVLIFRTCGRGRIETQAVESGALLGIRQFGPPIERIHRAWAESILHAEPKRKHRLSHQSHGIDDVPGTVHGCREAAHE